MSDTLNNKRGPFQIKVGPKQRHMTVPEGWELVTQGGIYYGDYVANLYSAQWEPVDRQDWEEHLDVDIYDFVIRPLIPPKEGEIKSPNV